jgi:uncharacterized damage-inducible protein DinB
MLCSRIFPNLKWNFITKEIDGMNMQTVLLQEFDAEMAHTRKTLERVPEKFDWKPHAKSMSIGRLAQHLSEIPQWAKETISKDELDLAPPGAPPHQPEVLKSRKEILDRFDKNLMDARTALADTSDDHLTKPWSLKMGGKTLMTMPRFIVLRNFVLNHNVHHRAQLGVYLRLNDVAVPSIYGPSADEGSM